MEQDVHRVARTGQGPRGRGGHSTNSATLEPGLALSGELGALRGEAGWAERTVLSQLRKRARVSAHCIRVSVTCFFVCLCVVCVHILWARAQACCVCCRVAVLVCVLSAVRVSACRVCISECAGLPCVPTCLCGNFEEPNPLVGCVCCPKGVGGPPTPPCSPTVCKPSRLSGHTPNLTSSLHRPWPLVPDFPPA